MKRLFQVGDQYFDSKADAKAARGTYTPPKADEKIGKFERYVSKGPDHVHFGRYDTTPNANEGNRVRRKASAELAALQAAD